MLQRDDNLADALRHARVKAGLTQDRLAELLVVSSAAVGNWESGNNLPMQKSVDKLNSVLFGDGATTKKAAKASKTVVVPASAEKTGNANLSSYDTEKLTAELKRRGFKVTLTF